MESIKQIAKTCHEVNKAYCESIGDFTQVSWDDAPKWQKKSAFDGVTYLFDNPNATCEDLHNNWMRDKKADGWVYGIVKNAEAKTHPNLKPYNFLSAEDRMKDTLFISVVKSFFI